MSSVVKGHDRVVAARATPNRSGDVSEMVTVAAANGWEAGDVPRTGAGLGSVHRGQDAESNDSSDSEYDPVGDVPLRWYDGYDHVGYDLEGARIVRKRPPSALERLAGTEAADDWRVLYDARSGNEIRLNDDQVALLLRLCEGSSAGGGGDVGGGTEEVIAWAPSQPHPLDSATESRRRFEPSRHEARQVAYLVRGLREGRIRPMRVLLREREEQRSLRRYHYDLWGGESEEAAADAPLSRAARAHQTRRLPPPKPLPPGHAESYNPPPEYLPTDGEAEAWRKADPEDRLLPFLPRRYASLRQVPAYEHLLREARTHRGPGDVAAAAAGPARAASLPVGGPFALRGCGGGGGDGAESSARCGGVPGQWPMAGHRRRRRARAGV
eukprot:ctg_208.g134